ncbi:hypothetical protein [Mycolicibacterium sarraceniae]|uniref:Uncharacterized protein n=1 Tax=Mycolicibacterium sarraceniae TaxID=1534348 RepID=A0A7I7SJ58_9MYCO|nr:hypothetical protein [Mycolicibacterium sarraceniae]BBY57004.1 hypothetical protein MSAR_01400 [Mycolicibacterium sarraceniae]
MILLSHPASAALLADSRPALLIGEVIGTLLFPAVGVPLLVLGLLGAGVNVLTSVNEHKAESTAPPVNVGQCITGEAMASGVIGARGIVACSQPAGVFEVVSAGGRDAPSPDGARDPTDYRDANVKHPLVDRTRTDTIKPVACTDASAEFTVLQRFEKTDYDLCPVGSHQRIGTDPPRTYCTGPPA